MARWQLTLSPDTLDRGSPGPGADGAERLPLFVRIARSIAEDIRRGRLRPGQELSSSRLLARELGVHRNTVLAAYRELAAEGWIVAEQAKGTFVSDELPEASPRRLSPARGQTLRPANTSGYDLPTARLPRPRATLPSNVLSMAGGKPDMRLAPTNEISRAFRRALRAHGRTLLDYGDSAGHPGLRRALLTMLAARRGLTGDIDRLLVTGGSQMAVYLAARSLFQPGQAVGVEALGYRPAWESLRIAGLRLVPIPIDSDGLRVDKLMELTAKHDLRGVYVTPHHQYPTTATLTAPRRLDLLEFARQERLAILEDDYDHEFHFEGRPVLPLAAADRAGVVLYIGSLSKVLAPGLRVGYAFAPPPVIERMSRYRSFLDNHGEHVIEAAIADMLEEGELQRHVSRMRRSYRSRRDALVESLRASLSHVLTFEVPAGGMALWAKVDAEVPVNAWAAQALSRGVGFSTGHQFRFDGRRVQYARFGFAMLSEEELVAAVRVLTDSLPG